MHGDDCLAIKANLKTLKILSSQCQNYLQNGNKQKRIEFLITLYIFSLLYYNAQYMTENYDFPLAHTLDDQQHLIFYKIMKYEIPRHSTYFLFEKK